MNGEYTNQVERTFKDLKRFWNIKSDDIFIVAQKSTMFQDIDKIYEAFELRYPGRPDSTKDYYVQTMFDIFNNEHFWGGTHPQLSIGAIAINADTSPSGVGKIVIGDGTLMDFDAIGLGDVVPQAIVAHEFGHHLLWRSGVPNFLGDARELVRFFELAPDAMAGYYLTHKRGATMNWKRAEQFYEVFFNIGDCYHDFWWLHSGTYRQRRAAAKWGHDLAVSAQKNGHILTVQEVLAKLQEEYQDKIVNCSDCLVE